MLARIAAAWVAAVLVLLGIHFLLPQRSGPLGLTQVMEPYILLSGVVAAAVTALSRHRRSWQIGLAALLVVAVIARCAPSVASIASAGEDGIRVAAWNMLSADDARRRVVAGLVNLDADLVGLEELRIEAGRGVEEDPILSGRYPYMALAPEQTVLGVGLLSRFPILEHETWSDPPLLRAVVATTSTERLSVFVGHPLPARIQGVARVPVALDATERDADISFIRSLVDVELAAGRGVIVLGDFNVTEREPAYADLAAGLRDAHLDSGVGPGLTWRPPALRALPFGLLRIDYVLSSPRLKSVATHVDCSAPSDHCVIAARLVQDFVIAQPTVP
jgi:endonuclease/exonuclease/phosphatase (EEP) superfamily protein YafD